MQPVKRAHDPAPSRLRYRLSRLWRRRSVRRAVTMQIPAVALAAVAAALASDPDVHAAVGARIDAAREALTAQQVFAVTAVEIEGADPSLEARIRIALADIVGASSLDLDAAALRETLLALGPIGEAEVALKPPSALTISVTAREPAAVWRVQGRAALIDAEGARIEDIASRAAFPELPLLIGAGAADHVDEALAILDEMAPLADRVIGLIRVGERRWDVALTRGARLMLPMREAAEAARIAMTLTDEDDVNLLERDVVAVDLRLPERPTVRLGAGALEILTLRRAGVTGEDA